MNQKGEGSAGQSCYASGIVDEQVYLHARGVTWRLGVKGHNRGGFWHFCSERIGTRMGFLYLHKQQPVSALPQYLAHHTDIEKKSRLGTVSSTQDLLG